MWEDEAYRHIPMKKDSAKTSWGKEASWYDDLLEGKEDTYQSRVILPNILRLADPQKGKVILDLACGQGFFARALAEKGATVFASDISSELIALAKAKGGPITYYVSSAEQLGFLKDAGVDAVVCVLAVQNMQNIAPVFKEVSRVLRTGGEFVMVLNHPAFRIPQASDWGYDEENGVGYRRVETYMSELEIEIDMHPGIKTRGRSQTFSYHRPLQVYSKTLANAGFTIKRIEEWMSHKESGPGPRQMAENRVRNEIPLFMMLQAVKTRIHA